MTPKLLYVGAKYDYGDKTRGLSFEHRNLHHSLQSWCERQGWELVPYDFYTRGQEIGQDGMTQELYDLAQREKPAFLFSVLVDHHLDPHHQVFSEIGRSGETVTMQWFCDDHWRWENYSRQVAPHFHFVMTTACSALPKYAEAGLGNRVIKTQWACNHELYVPCDTPHDIDVSFVGMPHGDRVQVLNALTQSGLSVSVFGHGWQGRPRLPFHQMVRLFSRSKINLNLSNDWAAANPQIKGRNFEVPGAGGFLLSGQADNLGDYYEEGREIITYGSVEDLADKAHYYLSHETERSRIAENGRRRTLAEHTWHHRYDQIFRAIGRRLTAETATERPRDRETPPLSVEGARAFNFLSVLNWEQDWQTLVQAYVEEFAQEEDVALILRPSSIHGQPVEEMAADMDTFIENVLARNLDHAPDIIFEVSPLTEAEMPRLYLAVQCLLLPSHSTNASPAATGLPTLGADGSDAASLRRQMRQAFTGQTSLRKAA